MSELQLITQVARALRLGNFRVDRGPFALGFNRLLLLPEEIPSNLHGLVKVELLAQDSSLRVQAVHDFSAVVASHRDSPS